MIISIISGLILIIFLIHHHFLPPIPKLKNQAYPYAILLGCPCHDDGTLSRSQIKRCNLAIKAYDNNKFETLIISGGAVKNKYYESKEMAKYISAHSNMNIICETKARNTFENFTYTKEITNNAPILVLTSSLHARRSCAIAKQFYREYSAYTYPDRKIKHILREIVSRFIYIKIEIQKKAKVTN